MRKQYKTKNIEARRRLGHSMTLNHLIYLSWSNLPSTLWPVKRTVDSASPTVGTDFLTRSEVSKLLGVSPNTVTRWAREGRLACQVTLGGHHRFERELVDQVRKSLCRAGSRFD
jgi:excisionase family DNA binding protein